MSDINRLIALNPFQSPSVVNQYVTGQRIGAETRRANEAEMLARQQAEQAAAQQQERSRLMTMGDPMALARAGFLPAAESMAGIQGTMSEAERRRAQTKLGQDQFGLDRDKFGLEEEKFGLQERQFGAEQAEKKSESEWKRRKEAIDRRTRSLDNIAAYGPERAHAMGLYVDPNQFEAVSKDPALLEQIRQQNVDEKLDTKIFDNETKLRQRFEDLSKGFVAIRDAHSKVLTSVKNPSRAGDLALFINWFKIMDPTSVVTSGETANAENAANVPDQWRQAYNSLLKKKGGKLLDNVRMDFVNRAQMMYDAKLDSQKRLESRYTELAGQYPGLRPENIVHQERIPENLKLPSQPQQAGSDNLPAGFVLD